MITIDGLRVEYPDGFGLARASNTTPVIVLRFEADNEAALARIQEDFRRVLQRRSAGRCPAVLSSVEQPALWPMQPAQELFLGRQPILDRNQNLAAFELLFRSGHFNGAQIEDDVFASATVINHAFSELGVETVLGKHTGLHQPERAADHERGHRAAAEEQGGARDPRNACASPTRSRERCKALKQMGFTLALDDFDRPWRTSSGRCSTSSTSSRSTSSTWTRRRCRAPPRRLKKLDVRLLAEKVDTREQSERCIELGYELFQGYYFAQALDHHRQAAEPRRDRADAVAAAWC